MNVKEEKICRLCLKIAESDYEIIDEIKINMFEVLLLRVNLGISKDPIVCRACTEISIKCFDFKSMCVDRRKLIFTSATEVNGVKLEFIDVIKREDDIEISDDNSICRFCANASNSNNRVKDDFTFVDMLQALMPEMDLDVTKNPVICVTCRRDLECYMKFAENCWNVEEKINKYCRNEGVPSSAQIQLSEFLFKNIVELDYVKKELEDISEAHSEVYNDKFIKVEEPLDIKDEETTQVESYKCSMCVFETKYKGSLKDHMIIHKDVAEVEMYKCSMCTYKTKRKRNLKEHTLIHKDVAEAEMYKCATCTYETKHKRNLQSHTLVHKDVTEIEMNKCSLCPYETKYKSCLKKHTLTHKNITDVEIYKCTMCTYETRQKLSLKRHILIHRDVTGAETYKCSMCNFVTILKCTLERHTLIHKDVKDVTMYKCSMCSYETKRKSGLKSHSLTHKNFTEVEMYECSTCTFLTKYKGSFKNHMLYHKRIAEMEIYKCSMCTFETRRKFSLQVHLKRHN